MLSGFDLMTPQCRKQPPQRSDHCLAACYFTASAKRVEEHRRGEGGGGRGGAVGEWPHPLKQIHFFLPSQKKKKATGAAAPSYAANSFPAGAFHHGAAKWNSFSPPSFPLPPTPPFLSVLLWRKPPNVMTQVKRPRFGAQSTASVWIGGRYVKEVVALEGLGGCKWGERGSDARTALWKTYLRESEEGLKSGERGKGKSEARSSFLFLSRHHAAVWTVRQESHYRDPREDLWHSCTRNERVNLCAVSLSYTHLQNHQMLHWKSSWRVMEVVLVVRWLAVRRLRGEPTPPSALSAPCCNCPKMAPGVIL